MSDAKALCIEMCGVNPDDPDLWNLLSSINGMLGDIDEAARCCRRAVELQPDHIEAHINLGNVLVHQGRQDEALEQYRTVLRLDPAHTGAQSNIARIQATTGRYDAAEAAYRRLLEHHPDLAEGWYNLGTVQLSRHRHGEAVRTFRHLLSMAPDSPRIDDIAGHGPTLMQHGDLEDVRELFGEFCRIKPTHAEAWFILSSIAGRCGDMETAANSARRVIELNPDHSPAHMNLAKALASLGRPEEAVEHFHTVLTHHPRVAAIHTELANTLAAAGRPREAEASYAEALRLDPAYAEPHCGLGILMSQDGRYDEAVAHYKEAIRLKPDYAIAYANLGAVLYAQRNVTTAVENLRRAIELDPNFANGYDTLAFVYREVHRLEEAEVLAKKACRLSPESAKVHYTLANIYHAQGRTKAAIEENRRVLELDPSHTVAHSAMLMCMEHRPEYTADDLAAASREWAARHVPGGITVPPFSNTPDPLRRLRIGYVSADLRRHPVGHMMEPLLAHLDRSHYEVFCYYNYATSDDVSRRLRASADHWRDIAGRSDQEAVHLIRDDQIDVLVDLSGHSAENRLLMLARRPAPVQATWLGYFDTTGMKAMDYIIADRFVIPPAHEHNYMEQVIRLPICYEIYPPPADAVEPGPPPALSTGKITFGCFNNNTKITEQVIACWARLLHSVADSRLCLKGMAYVDGGVTRRYSALFAEHGIGPERIEFRGHSPRNEMLAQYNDIDIALDPFPYNGGMTTFEALWMGVPVINLRGERFVSRMGETILSAAGLSCLVTATEDEYIAKAIALAQDIPKLAERRMRQRNQVSNSPLCDAPGFARGMEQAYRTMWRAWCRRPHASRAAGEGDT